MFFYNCFSLNYVNNNSCIWFCHPKKHFPTFMLLNQCDLEKLGKILENIEISS